ncbi:hypothetical protein GCM10027290_05220 [Micromonospora sonneratiae]|uniref:Phosphotransferase enzyme family protein n=1 Tax=Micromonospora sonneratiae TaxID=1184706 RepID=A0ABW3YLZ1_9ACTN
MPPAPDAHILAKAFRLPDPIGPLAPVRYVSSETWRLDTIQGSYFVKRLLVDGWRDQLEQAMAFERQAHHAGLPIPEPIEPTNPAWGLATDLGDTHGVVRVHTWLDSTPLPPDTDHTQWYGATLATLHTLEPAGERRTDTMWPLWYGINAPQTWESWLAAGLGQGRTWAPLLKEQLALVTDLTERIETAYWAADDYVITHRDLVPHNVLMVPDRGPVLIDWDTAGPDSATLETYAAALDYARHTGTPEEPDLTNITAILAAYRSHGGILRPTEFALARRLGVHLARIAERIRITLGLQPGGSIDPAAAQTRLTQQLAALPGFSSRLIRWSQQLTDH